MANNKSEIANDPGTSRKDTVNVVMAVYNEEKTLTEIINRVLKQKIVDRLIIIDDNSKDNSLKIIKAIAKKDKRIEYLANASNKGKGYSVRRGLELVKEGIVIIQDADLEYYPEDYVKLISEVKKDTAVLGTRVHTEQEGYNYIIARFVNFCLTSEFDILYNRNLTDINTCYKVFRKEMLDGIKLKEEGFLIDPEIMLALVKKGYRIVEVNIRYSGRTFKEGKKITAKDAMEQALFIVKKRFQ